MERLIARVDYSDGYTYSCESHLPIVYSSKEEFIIAFEDKIKEILIVLEAINKKVEKSQQALTEKQKQVIKKGEISDKEKEKAHKELLELLAINRKNLDEHSSVQNFKLGGQEFSIMDFTSGERGEISISVPEVYTLDEFFEQVEQNKE